MQPCTNLSAVRTISAKDAKSQKPMKSQRLRKRLPTSLGFDVVGVKCFCFEILEIYGDYDVDLFTTAEARTCLSLGSFVITGVRLSESVSGIVAYG
jgi:hypothetical protein